MTAYDELMQLLCLDRELTADEQRQLDDFSAETMADVLVAARDRAHRAYLYSRIDVDKFAECVFEHLDHAGRRELVAADMFCCPVCGRLLKDRG